MRRTLPLLTVLALPLCLPAPVHAQPRVTLKLDRVTLPEALKALQRESGWEFKVEKEFALDLAPEADAPRASFAWEQQPVGVVCREVAAKFGLAARKTEQRRVEFRSGLPPEPQPLTSVTREGFRVSVSELRREAAVSQEFVREKPGPVQRACTLVLTLRAPDGDPDHLFGLQNLQVETDRGPAESSSGDSWRRGDRDESAPDEWSLRVNLSRLPPRAQQIVRISGDLLVYPALPSGSIRVPVVSARPVLPKNLGPVTLRLLDWQAAEDRVRMDVDAIWSTNALGAVNGQEWPLPTLTTREGRTYVMTGGRSTTVESGVRRLTLRLSALLPHPEDPPAYLLWDVPRTAEEPERLSFRFRGLPIPRLPEDMPMKPAPGGK